MNDLKRKAIMNGIMTNIKRNQNLNSLNGDNNELGSTQNPTKA